MSINMPNECFLQVGIGGVDDIVHEITSFELEIKERIGNLLPVALMTIVPDIDLLSSLDTEHAPVYISIGFHEDTAAYSKWQINGFDEIGGKIIFVLTVDRSYVNDTAFKAYDDQSCNAIKKVAEKYFETKDTNGKSMIKLTATNDKMKWIQHGNSMRDFVNEVWLHSWADNRLMMPVISAFKGMNSDKAGTFKLIDMTDLKNPIEITRKAVEEKDNVKDGVWLIQDLNYKSNSSIYNTDIGNRAYSIFDVDKAETKIEEIKPKPIFKGDFNAANIKTYKDPIHSMSDNVHKNYAKAKASNLSRLSKFEGNVKKIAVIDYGKITIGDVVLVTIPMLNSSETNDTQSGAYIVSEVKQTITTEGHTKKYVKELTLRRDANLVLENKELVKG